MKLFKIGVLSLLIFVSCKEQKKTNQNNTVLEETSKEKTIVSHINAEKFDTIIDSKKVILYWIENKDIKVAFTNYGARIVGLWVPDFKKEMTDVVIGMGSTKGYKNSTEPYFGATIGRVGNRIAKGAFSLEGEKFNIPINNGKNSLHGGDKGFQDVVWNVTQPNDSSLVFTYTSPDMEQGFPGTLKVKVTYTATSKTSIKMDYEATTDKTTVVNLTNHAFFNLNGEGSGSILNHTLKIYAEKYTPVDDGLIPTGEILSVKNTPFDFVDFHTIGERVNIDNEQLKFGGGYDHNYVLNETKSNDMNYAASVKGEKSKILMDVYTKEPGLQFYSGNFMQSKNTLKSGSKDDFRTAFCLETQHYPDAPNQPKFPSIVLNPGEIYKTSSEYKFSIDK